VAIEPFWKFAILGKEVLVKPLIIAVSLPVITILPATGQLTYSNQYAQLQQSTAQDASQMKMDAVPSLNQDGIRRVQQALQKRGFDPGPLDGILGPKTKEAVRNFQDRYGIKASGEIDNQTLFALGEVELAA
jgi:peptidoglycan hydrolase-like protein with peptidoglycan-binding domain